VTWVRSDDNCPNHPKVVRAGAEAAWLWHSSICYSNAHKLNGRIDKDLIGAMYSPLAPKASKLAAVLVRVGLWHDHGDHYEIHDYAEYQEQALKESVEERRRYERERKRAQRSGTKPTPSTNGCPGHVRDIPMDTAGAVPSVTRASPVPSRPVPSKERGESAPPPASFADSVGAPNPEPDQWTEVAAAWVSAGWQGDQHTAKRDFVRIAEHARRQCGDRWLDETRSRLTRWLEAKHERIHKPPKWFLEDWPSLDATASSGPPEPADLQAEWTRLHNRELRLAEAQRDLGRLSADERLEREGEIATGLLEVRKSMRTIRSQIEASERRPRP
jgi:hypothetical protein